MEDNIQSPDVSNKIIVKHALNLLQHTTWADFQMRLLAQDIGTSSSQLYGYVSDKTDLLKNIINEVNDWMKTSYQEIQQFGSITRHDQLFDVIMCRLEVMHPHKKAFQHLYDGIWTTPCQLFQTCPKILQSLGVMLEMASISTDGIFGMIKLKAFGIVYGIILKEWLKEEISEPSDMMIEIDKRLKQMAPILKMS